MIPAPAPGQLADDPYSLVMAELWAVLEADDKFSLYVKPGNRIRYVNGSPDPEKETVSTADTPEVRIIPVSSEPGRIASSSSYSDRMTFEIQWASGDQRADYQHLKLRWLIFRAFMRENRMLARVKALTYNGNKFVQNVFLESITDGVSQQDLNRGIKGWSGIMAVSVEMIFGFQTAP